jgi:hypothetical protein
MVPHDRVCPGIWKNRVVNHLSLRDHRCGESLRGRLHDGAGFSSFSAVDITLPGIRNTISVM